MLGVLCMGCRWGMDGWLAGPLPGGTLSQRVLFVLRSSMEIQSALGDIPGTCPSRVAPEMGGTQARRERERGLRRLKEGIGVAGQQLAG